MGSGDCLDVVKYGAPTSGFRPHGLVSKATSNMSQLLVIQADDNVATA